MICTKNDSSVDGVVEKTSPTTRRRLLISFLLKVGNGAFTIILSTTAAQLIEQKRCMRN